jgi:hypothetical protein
METIMKPGLLVALVGILLAVSACVVAPSNAGPGYYYTGGYYEHDYGRPVWRQ